MVDLGFTIMHQCDETFYQRIRASAPAERVPDVAAAEAEAIAEATRQCEAQPVRV
jgi:hypothetical protein